MIVRVSRFVQHTTSKSLKSDFSLPSCWRFVSSPPYFWNLTVWNVLRLKGEMFLSLQSAKKKKKINEKADPVASNWVWLLNVAASVGFQATQTSRLHDFQIFWPLRSRFVAVSTFTVKLYAEFSRQWRWGLFSEALTFLKKRRRRPG